MSVSMYMDRDGDIWAVRSSDGTAVCVVLREEIADDRTSFDTALFALPSVERRYGPLRRLEVVAESVPPPDPPALADVLRAMGEEIHARVQVEANIHSGGDAYAVLNFLDGVFARAIRQAEGGAT